MQFFQAFASASALVTTFIEDKSDITAMNMFKTTLLAAASVLVAAGCTDKTVEPRFGILSIDTLLDNTRAECRVEYGFASIRNATDSPALEAIESANIGYFFQLEEFAGNAELALETSLHEIATMLLDEIPQTGAGGASYEITAESAGEVVDTLVSYTISRWSYTGGAHGMYGIECHTYSLAEGYELTAAELFGEERLPRLDSLIRQRIHEDYGTRDDEGLTALGFFPEEIGITENFSVSSEGVVFHYNPYDIGCYALGPVEVEIGREELEQL